MKKALPVGTMFMVLVIALAVMGVGYALWSETLTISGSVQTGEVDIEFSQHPVLECVDVNGELTCPEPPEKADAANCTVAWSNTATDPNDTGANNLLVTVTGMYPSYHCKVGFDITSTGTVPVHIWQPEPTGDIPPWVAYDFSCYPAGFQLHQGESTGVCTMDIHFSNEIAPPESSGPFTFGWTILATQWNEDPVKAEIITVPSSTFNFSQTGWAGWSCPASHPFIVSADTSNCTQPLGVSQAAMPGVGTYPVYPHYTFGPNEQGWVVQNGGTAQSCNIVLSCSDTGTY
jgi:hypothetical protein